MKLTSIDTVQRLAQALAHDFTLMPLHAPEAPVFLAVAAPTDDGVTGLKPRLPAGRGMTARQAMIAAGAEALELRASLAQNRAAQLSRLPRTDGYAMVPATDLMSGADVAVLAQEIYLDCAAVLGEPLACDANSTGCAVGLTREVALATAVWECVERDAVALWWHGQRPPLALALEVIDDLQPRLFWWLHQRERRTMLLDLTTDIGLPVVAAVSSDPDGRVVAMGSAARPVLADAALAAVTEMVQTEVSISLARDAGDPETLAWIDHAVLHGQAQFQPTANTDSAGYAILGLEALVTRLCSLGHRVLAVELTLPGDPLPTLRAIIPGLCAMQGRIDTERFARLCPGAHGPNLPEPF